MLQTIQVCEYESFLPSLVEVYRLEADDFQAGQLPYFVNEWRALTSDNEILETVTGQHIEFNETPVQINPPFQPCWREKEACIIDTEISDPLSKGVITESVHERDEFISTIFLRPKKDGTHRMILNLKSLNQYVTYHHFKMDTIHTAVEMMTPGCYMCSVDLKSAYYSVAIAPSDQKYLKFSWRGKLYQFTCFPNGLAFCPRKFTKLLKPVYSTLRNLGHLSVAYIDDSYLQADTYELCVHNVIDTLSLFHQLGFVIHPDKSVLIPTQRLTFLGFVLDSQSMTVTLTGEQAVKVKEACQRLLQEKAITIREVAKVLGLLTSSLPGVLYGPLHYRSLEMDKTQALKSNQGNFDSIMALSGEAVADLHWWINSVEETSKPVKQRETQITMTTDASKKGWGCSVEGTSTGGSWTHHEAQYHINYLETKAVFLALQAFSHEVSGKCVSVLVDNTTAVSCINQMGTCHSKEINSLVRQIWEWCISHSIWITVSHIPGKENTIADRESRKQRRETEWALDTEIFDNMLAGFSVKPDIDLFASRINYKCKQYVSYQPDPGAYAVDAFHLPWKDFCFYAFPPFCIIQKVLRKVTVDQATGILVVPHWPTQPWWPLLTHLLIAPPFILPRRKDTLYLASKPEELHPLHKTLTLLGCHLSGNSLLVKAF